MPHDIEANWVVERDSAEIIGVPRAVLCGLLHGHPGGVTIFYPPLWTARKIEVSTFFPAQSR
jgi:hypothetical protein